MKKTTRHISFVLFFTVIWILLNEKLTVLVVLSGLIVSEVSLLFVNRFLVNQNYIDTYGLHPMMIIRYSIHLLFHIYHSGINSLIKVVKGEDTIGIITYHTDLTDEVRIGLLANAVTSTPGTVTIHKSKQTLNILYLGDFDDKVLRSFEKILEIDGEKEEERGNKP